MENGKAMDRLREELALFHIEQKRRKENEEYLKTHREDQERKRIERLSDQHHEWERNFHNKLPCPPKGSERLKMRDFQWAAYGAIIGGAFAVVSDVAFRTQLLFVQKPDYFDLEKLYYVVVPLACAVTGFMVSRKT